MHVNIRCQPLFCLIYLSIMLFLSFCQSHIRSITFVGFCQSFRNPWNPYKIYLNKGIPMYLFGKHLFRNKGIYIANLRITKKVE